MPSWTAKSTTSLTAVIWRSPRSAHSDAGLGIVEQAAGATREDEEGSARACAGERQVNGRHRGPAGVADGVRRDLHRYISAGDAVDRTGIPLRSRRRRADACPLSRRTEKRR